MRIKLVVGKQKELIEKAKKGRTWNDLSKILGLNKDYIRNELKKEKRIFSRDVYEKLNALIGVNFDKFITEEREDTWGQSKGGLNSDGSKIKITKPKFDKGLAEFIGILLGDGNINYYKKGKKIGVYQIKIAGDFNKDKEYHLNYIRKLVKDIFSLEAKETTNEKHGERFLFISSKELIEFFNDMGLRSGNKIKNKLGIPNWIFENKGYLEACLRGLIDTDGSIFKMSNKDPRLLRISFTNNNSKLLKDTRNAFITLGFNPSKLIGNQFFISRKKEVQKYINEIGFSNSKHQKRLKNIAPWCSGQIF